MSTAAKKIILVIGATGAQGIAVIDALLAASADGSSSPYAIRALTRDPTSKRAQELTAKGVECFKGSFTDFAAVEKAMAGAYGAWVNTDGFSEPEEAEIFAGMRIFEIAKQVGSVRHYVYSSLDNVLKLGNYNQEYYTDHYMAKARVADWIRVQASAVGDSDVTWTSVSTGPYMDMLNMYTLGPLNTRPDGTLVFATAIGPNGRMPLISLSDLGYFARYTFDNRAAVSGQELKITTEMVGWDHLVETFTKVTGKKAVAKYLSVEEWIEIFTNVDRPLVPNPLPGGKQTTWRENFSSFLKLYRDNLIKRDMNWIKSVNPKGETLESWMKKNNYVGRIDVSLLKDPEDNMDGGINWEKVRAL